MVSSEYHANRDSVALGLGTQVWDLSNFCHTMGSSILSSLHFG